MHCDRKTVSSTQVSQVLRIISHQAEQNRALHVNKSLTTQQTPSTLPHSRPNLPPTPRPYRPRRTLNNQPQIPLAPNDAPPLHGALAAPIPRLRLPQQHRHLRPRLQTLKPSRNSHAPEPHRALVVPPSPHRFISAHPRTYCRPHVYYA
jgi:hypothetical protein